MIDAKELRIANMLLVDNEYDRVNAINSQDSYIDCDNAGRVSLYADEIEPIPLTPELLEQIGFHENGSVINGPIYYIAPGNKGLFSIQDKKNGEYRVWWNNPDCIYAPMQNVHQLQNLFHCLTGEELAINL